MLQNNCLTEPISTMRSIKLLLPYLGIPLPLALGKPLMSGLGISFLLGLRRSDFIASREVLWNIS